MKGKLSDITFNKMHLLEKHGVHKLVIFNMIIVNAHSGEKSEEPLKS